jgi:hypothetical protein
MGQALRQQGLMEIANSTRISMPQRAARCYLDDIRSLQQGGLYAKVRLPDSADSCRDGNASAGGAQNHRSSLSPLSGRWEELTAADFVATIHQSQGVCLRSARRFTGRCGRLSSLLIRANRQGTARAVHNRLQP